MQMCETLIEPELEMQVNKKQALMQANQAIVYEIDRIGKQVNQKTKEYSFEVQELQQLAQEAQQRFERHEFILQEDKSREEGILEAQNERLDYLDLSLRVADEEYTRLMNALKANEEDQNRALNFMKVTTQGGSPYLGGLFNVIEEQQASPKGMNFSMKNTVPQRETQQGKTAANSSTAGLNTPLYGHYSIKGKKEMPDLR
ncbi:hypothetical protein FGO68_gene7537 [Halteria grandinella]|uniref:Uncharacterized protein n=1 Tax=Halteria grandinella TaxID=5974 RepID=A0A8J8NBH0_HALGN|nr:hypothetical protein FGO68_gene7537 [Halteria grandinella]